MLSWGHATVEMKPLFGVELWGIGLTVFMAFNLSFPGFRAEVGLIDFLSCFRVAEKSCDEDLEIVPTSESVGQG